MGKEGVKREWSRQQDMVCSCIDGYHTEHLCERCGQNFPKADLVDDEAALV